MLPRVGLRSLGPIDRDDPDWWRDKVLGRWFSDDVQRAVVARGPNGIEGYASFTYGPAKGAIDFNYLIQRRHLVATSVEGYASLLSYLRGFRGLGVALRFTGPPAHPLGLLVEEQRVLPVWTYRWMLRLLDVPAALSQRGYPPVSGEAVLAVEDGLFPENRGPWLLEADGSGSVAVSPTTSRVRPVTIGALGHVQRLPVAVRRGGARAARRSPGAVPGPAVRRAGALDARLLLSRSPSTRRRYDGAAARILAAAASTPARRDPPSATA